MGTKGTRGPRDLPTPSLASLLNRRYASLTVAHCDRSATRLSGRVQGAPAWAVAVARRELKGGATRLGRAAEPTLTS